MGGRIETREVVFVRDENSNLLLDGSATIFNIQLEDSLGNGFIREEATVTKVHIILEDNLNSTGNIVFYWRTNNYSGG